MHEGRNPQRSKSGRDRNNYRSAPARDTQRTETTSPIQRRHGRIGRRHVDERSAFRDIDRTCVPGTVWGTASSRTAKSRSTPCLSLRRPSLPQHPPRRQGATTRRRINLSHAPSSSRQPRDSAKLTTTPSKYGFAPPSTIKDRVFASGLRCSRGSYRQHATKGSNANKGDPSGSGASL